MDKKKISVLCVLTLLMTLFYVQMKWSEKSNSGILYRMSKGESIESIHLQNENGDFEFYKSEEGVWSVEEEVSYSVNETKMDLLLSALSEFTVLRKLDGEDSRYGLDDYTARVSFTTGKGKQHEFLVGSPTMSQSDVYVKNMDNGEIVITDAASTAQLTGGISAYRQKEIFKVDLDQIVKFTYQKAGKEVVSVEQGMDGQWNMISPFQVPARKIEISEFLSDMKDWNLYGYADTKAHSPESMGLDGSGAVLNLWDSKGCKQTLEFGTADAVTAVVRNGGKDDVLLLYSEEVDLSGLSAESLMLVAPFRNNLDQVVSIDLMVNDTEISLHLDHDTGIVSCDGHPLDPTAFNSFYVSLMSLSAAGGEADQVVLQKPVFMRIEVTMSDSSDIKVEYSDRDSKTCYMTIDGTTRYYISRDKLVKLVEKLQRCLTQSENK